MKTATKKPYPTTTSARADYLLKLYSDYVRTVTPGNSWKASCAAVVPTALVGDVRDAMTFMGSYVDNETEIAPGVVTLYSRGYWAHGF